jgi:hypothetical protein
LGEGCARALNNVRAAPRGCHIYEYGQYTHQHLVKKGRLDRLELLWEFSALCRYVSPPALSRSNGSSVTVTAEGHRSVSELVPHRRVVSGVLWDAQT